MVKPLDGLPEALRLPPELEQFLRETNAWWGGGRGRVLPAYRRWAFPTLLRRLHAGLAPAVVVRGARQVGKTTLQEQAIEHLIVQEGVEPSRILRVQFDEIPNLHRLREPIFAFSRWFQNQVLGRTFNEAAHAGQPAYLFFDEVQNLPDWAPQIKSLVDHHTVHVVVTGSSALRIEAGRDSLAGRITTIELGTLLLREIAGLRFGRDLAPLLPPNGLEPLLHQEFWQAAAEQGRAQAELRDEAFSAFSERGGYPIAHALESATWPEIADQLNENVVRKVIRHDLRLGDRGRSRDPALLEEVFRLACRYIGQAPRPATYLAEIRHVLQSDVGWQRVLNYLRFLDGALLVRLVQPLELRLKRRTGFPKLCLLDHGLRAAWLEEAVPLAPAALATAGHLADLAGRIAESAVGAFFTGLPHLDVAHFPERPTEPEVDFVLTIGDRRIPVEVKYRRRIDPLRDTLGLRSFLEKAHYNAPFGLLVTLDDEARIPDPRIVCLPLSSLLLIR